MIDEQAMKSARFFGAEQSLNVVEVDRPTLRLGEILVEIRGGSED